MFRNLKCKNTLLCEGAYLFWPIMAGIGAFLAYFVIPNEDISIWVIGSLLAYALIGFISKAKTSFNLDFILTNLRLWQKDRLSFETDINGVPASEVEKAITARALKWGKAEENQNGAVLTRYKKTTTFTDLPKAVHQQLIVYTFSTLTHEEYSAKLENANAQADNLVLGKKDEESAVAIIFLCDRVDGAVLANVREDCNYTDDGNLVLPVVYDALTKQYHLNALYEYFVFSVMTTKNYLLNSIKKIVFSGKLPLDNNDRFDYSNEISVWQDKTLGELIDDIKEEEKKEKQYIKNIAEQLTDGQVLFHDDMLYLKHDGKLASYLVLPEEENPNEVFLWDVDVWEVPKMREISKKDQEILKQMATDYFKSQNKIAVFDIEE
ncbi:MAG: hypothetical protein IKB29_02770 [Clostridia bacterium]|nr:hypothetical protein [Clostridia bacterium]